MHRVLRLARRFVPRNAALLFTPPTDAGGTELIAKKLAGDGLFNCKALHSMFGELFWMSED